MGRPPKNQETPQDIKIEDIVESVLTQEDYSDQHYNNVTTPSYKVSSGSLNLDVKTGGGLTPSLIRFTGVSEGGKSSAALSYLTNFLNTPEQDLESYGVIIDAENRLNEHIKKRYPIKFVYDFKEFKPGTCFVLVTNCYEMAIDLMRQLVKGSVNTKRRFFFIVDSLDALISKDVIKANAEDVNNIAGMQKAVLTTRFLERFSTAMRKCGHIGIFISQVRSKITAMYQKPDPNSLVTNASGAHALAHGADWVFEFQSHLGKDYLFKETANNGDERIVGHMCRILLKKTQNDTTGEIVEYPIRRNAPPGKSVWREREIVDQMLQWDKLKKSGSWYYIDVSIIQLLKEHNIECPDKVQGIDSILEFFDQKPEAVDLLYSFFKDTIMEIYGNQ